MAKKEEKKVSPWLGRHPVLSDDDHPGLEAQAAVHQFHGGMPQKDAEERAYGDYRRSRALDAAAHHLLGMRAAHAAQDEDAAHSHHAAYSAAVTAVGGDPGAAPLQEVLDRIAEARPRVYSFKEHPSDRLLLAPDGSRESYDQQRLQVAIGRIKALAAGKG